jgi:hypothetical protein
MLRQTGWLESIGHINACQAFVFILMMMCWIQPSVMLTLCFVPWAHYSCLCWLQCSTVFHWMCYDRPMLLPAAAALQVELARKVARTFLKMDPSSSLHSVKYTEPSSRDSPAQLKGRELFTAACRSLGKTTTDKRLVFRAAPLQLYLRYMMQEPGRDSKGTSNEKVVGQAIKEALAANPRFTTYAAGIPEYNFRTT